VLPPNVLVGLLDKKKLAQLLHWYKSVPAASQSSVSGAAQQVSRLLLLDHAQAESLYHGFVREFYGGSAPLPLSDAVLTEIMEYYFDERLCLINIVSAILRNANDEEHPYNALCGVLAHELVDGTPTAGPGLEDLVLRLAKEQAEAACKVPPEHLNEYQRILWVSSAVQEVAALLDLMFLLYYQVCQCSCRRLSDLANAFQDIMFGARLTVSACAPLDSLARLSIQRIGYLCALILIESMSLEDAIDPTLATPTPSSQHRILTDEEGTMALDEKFVSWSVALATGSAPRIYAPVLAAWSALLCRGTQLGYPSASRLDFRSHLTHAFSYNPFSLCVSMLQAMDSSVEMAVEANILAYKCVLKGFVSAFLVSFELAILPPTIVSPLVELECEIFRKQPSLCLQFWEQDVNEAALRSLLDLALSRFPHDMSCLCSLLAALVSDRPAAHKALGVLEALPWFTCPVPTALLNNEVTVVLDSAEGWDVEVRGDSRGLVLDLPQKGPVSIPFRTPGRFVDDAAATAGSIRLVQWRVTYAAWSVFAAVIDRCACTEGPALVRDATAVVKLLNALMGAEESLASGLQQVFSAQPLYAPAAALLNGGQDSAVCRSGLAGRLMLLLQKACHLLSRNTNSDEASALVHSCLAASAPLARAYPQEVLTYAIRVGVLSPGPLRASFLGRIVATDMASGEYASTSALLAFVSAILNPQTPLDAKRSDTGNDNDTKTAVLSSLAQFVASDVFGRHHLWRYAHTLDRWNIASKCLQMCVNVVAIGIMQEACASHRKPSLGDVVLGVFNSDAGAASALFAVITAVEPALRRLVMRRGVVQQRAQMESVQEMLLLSLSMLGALLRISAAASEASPLVAAILLDDRSAIIPTIATFVTFPHDPAVPAAAITDLTLLSRCSTFLPRPPSLNTLLGPKGADLRSALVKYLLPDSQTSTSTDELRVRTLQLLGEALFSQAGLADYLFNAPRTLDIPAPPPTGASTVPPQSASRGEGCAVAITTLMSFADTTTTTTKSSATAPSALGSHVLARVCGLLQTLWFASTESSVASPVVQYFRNLPSFWRVLSISTLFHEDHDLSGKRSGGGGEDEGEGEAGEEMDPLSPLYDMLMARACVLNILGLETMLTPGTSSSSSSALVPVGSPSAAPERKLLPQALQEQVFDRMVRDNKLESMASSFLTLVPSTETAAVINRLKEIAQTMGVGADALRVQPALTMFEERSATRHVYDALAVPWLLSSSSSSACTDPQALVEACADANETCALAEARVALASAFATLIALIAPALPDHMLNPKSLPRIIAERLVEVDATYTASVPAYSMMACALVSILRHSSPQVKDAAGLVEVGHMLVRTVEKVSTAVRPDHSGAFASLRIPLLNASRIVLATTSKLQPQPGQPIVAGVSDLARAMLALACESVAPYRLLLESEMQQPSAEIKDTKAAQNERQVALAALVLARTSLTLKWADEASQYLPSPLAEHMLPLIHLMLTRSEARGQGHEQGQGQGAEGIMNGRDSSTGAAAVVLVRRREMESAATFVLFLLERAPAACDWLAAHRIIHTLLAALAHLIIPAMPPSPYIHSERNSADVIWCRILEAMSSAVGGSLSSRTRRLTPSMADAALASIPFLHNQSRLLAAGVAVPHLRTAETEYAFAAKGPGFHLTLAGLKETEAGMRLLVAAVAQRWSQCEAYDPGITLRCRHICFYVMSAIASVSMSVHGAGAGVSMPLIEPISKEEKQAQASNVFAMQSQLALCRVLLNCVRYIYMTTPSDVFNNPSVVLPSDLPFTPDLQSIAVQPSNDQSHVQSPAPLGLVLFVSKLSLLLLARIQSPSAALPLSGTDRGSESVTETLRTSLQMLLEISLMLCVAHINVYAPRLPSTSGRAAVEWRAQCADEVLPTLLRADSLIGPSESDSFLKLLSSVMEAAMAR